VGGLAVGGVVDEFVGVKEVRSTFEVWFIKGEVDGQV
jgi:hypothetical protein